MKRTIDLDKFLLCGAFLIFVTACILFNIKTLISLQDQIKSNDIEIKAIRDELGMNDSIPYTRPNPLLPPGVYYLPKTYMVKLNN